MTDDDDRPVILEPFDQLAQIGRVLFERVRSANVAQLAVAAQIDVDAAELVAEGGEDATPDRPVALPAVNEEKSQRRLTARR